jgi:serine/threonine protein kinase
VVGTPDYLSPEILLGTGHGTPADWWSLGIILYEFLTGVPPFNDDTPEQIFQNILKAEIEWPKTGEISPEARDLISKLTVRDPKKRLGSNGVDEIKKHPFFKDVDWSTLLEKNMENVFIPKPDDELDTSYFIDRGALATETIEDHASSGPDDPITIGNFSFTNIGYLRDMNQSLLPK